MSKRYAHNFPIVFAMGIALVFIGTLGCAVRPAPVEEERPILYVRGEAAYMPDLETLAVLAGYQLEIEEDRERFRQNAANFYETLIDLNVMKHVAIDMDLLPTDQELQEIFEPMRERLRQQGYYESMLAGLGITEAEFQETLAYQQAVRRLQEMKLREFEPHVSDEEVRQFYYQNNPQFRFPNRIRASHIYIAAPESANAEARSQARQRVEQLRRMIGDTPSRTFANLAQQYSEDANTRNRGGDLGMIRREDDTVDRRFLDAAFSLQEDEVSEVVETRYGYHIIWVTRHEIPLEEARDAIRRQLTNKHRDQQFKAWMQEVKADMDIERLFDPVEFIYIGEE